MCVWSALGTHTVRSAVGTLQTRGPRLGWGSAAPPGLGTPLCLGTEEGDQDVMPLYSEESPWLPLMLSAKPWKFLQYAFILLKIQIRHGVIDYSKSMRWMPSSASYFIRKAIHCTITLHLYTIHIARTFTEIFHNQEQSMLSHLPNFIDFCFAAWAIFTKMVRVDQNISA